MTVHRLSDYRRKLSAYDKVAGRYANEPRTSHPIPVIAALPELAKARAISARIAALQARIDVLQAEHTRTLDRIEHELTCRLPAHFVAEAKRHRRASGGADQ